MCVSETNDADITTKIRVSGLKGKIRFNFYILLGLEFEDKEDMLTYSQRQYILYLRNNIKIKLWDLLNL